MSRNENKLLDAMRDLIDIANEPVLRAFRAYAGAGATDLDNDVYPRLRDAAKGIREIAKELEDWRG